MDTFNYACPKCHNTSCDTGEIRTVGGFWSKIFDMQNRKFSSVTCSRCSYTEFYAADNSELGNIFDLFTD
jgi:hypothetical protein